MKWGAQILHGEPGITASLAGDDSDITSECTVLAKMSGGHYLPNRVTE